MVTHPRDIDDSALTSAAPEASEAHEAISNGACLLAILQSLDSPLDIAACACVSRNLSAACAFDGLWRTVYERFLGVPDDVERCSR